MSPQRPREHVLEELSRQAFRSALPAEWVVRSVDDDYGVDREVEIFSDGHTTGLTFKVQLKASDRVSRSGPSRRVTTDQVEYWKSLDVPVLIVYWVEETRELYGRWTHTLGREPGRAPDAKTTTVNYEVEDLLTDAAERLPKDVWLVRELRAGHLPQPFALCVRVEDSFTAASESEIIVRLRSLIRAHGLRSVVEVLPGRHDDHRPEFLVQLSGGRSTVLRASLPIDVASVRVVMAAGAYEEHQAPERLDVLASDVLVAMSVALERTGARAAAARLLDHVVGGSRIAIMPEPSSVVAMLLDDQAMADDAVALCLRLMNDEDPAAHDVSDTYLRVVMQHIHHTDEAAQTALVERMRRRAHQETSSSNPRRAGRVHYNLARLLGSLGEREAMLPEFTAALVHDPGYQGRGYFFRERGGVRWDLGDYLGTADDYRQALLLGADPAEVQPLMVDALMWAGRYADALRALADWTPSGHQLDRLAVLDGIALAELARITGLTQQDRRGADLETIQTAGEDPEQLIELLRSTDALDPRLWMSLVQSKLASLPQLIIIALVCQHDPLPWAIATAATFMAEDKQAALLSHVVGSAVDLTDDDAYVAAVGEVADEMLDASSASRLRTAVYDCMASLPDRYARIAARVISDGNPG